MEVYNSLIKNPVAFTYAFTNFNVCSDLCNSYGLPALQFRSHVFDDGYYCTPLDWATCDQTVFGTPTAATAIMFPTGRWVSFRV